MIWDTVDWGFQLVNELAMRSIAMPGSEKSERRFESNKEIFQTVWTWLLDLEKARDVTTPKLPVLSVDWLSDWTARFRSKVFAVRGVTRVQLARIR